MYGIFTYILPTLSIIILQSWVIFRANVGKSSSTMERRHRLPGRGALPQRGRQTATELQRIGRHGAWHRRVRVSR
jgi:hypothetical protein